jgi:hypothetical protein
VQEDDASVLDFHRVGDDLAHRPVGLPVLRVNRPHCVLEVELLEHAYRVLSGDPVIAHHYGREFAVSVASPISFAGHYHTRDSRPSSAEGQTDPRATPIDARSGA